MRDRLVQIVLTFLTSHVDETRPVLLGLSGGGDSLALLYLLLECKKNLKFHLGVAHVDHGWRYESGQESLQLEKLAKQLDLPFFLKRLCLENLSGNLEATCREERLNFFSELCKEHDYQAVILAHHQNDQAETVLKNLLEGASLSLCTGMLTVAQIDGLTLWRPLLDIPKKSLSKWLQDRQITPFFDATNLDKRFLRGRMRTQIIPELGRMFGKKIDCSLSCIGRESQELQLFLKKHLALSLQSIETTPSGSFLDFSQFSNTHTPFEIKYMVRKLCEREGCYPSREILENTVHLLVLRSANRRFSLGKNMIFVDRARLFVTSVEFVNLPKERVAITGSFRYGPWVLKLEDQRDDSEEIRSDWKTVWDGWAEVVLPFSKKSYEIGPPSMYRNYPRTSSISKWWNNHKIPAFLRAGTPVIWAGDVIVHEFLTGKKKPVHPRCEHWQRIRLARTILKSP